MVTTGNDYSRPPKDKAELLKRIDREWKALEKSYAGLSDDRMSVPDAGGWSIKDNLAHLSDWEHVLLASYIRKKPAAEVLNIDAETLKTLDDNGINAILYPRNKDRPVADVLAGLRKEHAELRAALAKMPFEEMMQPRDSADPQKRPLIGWIIGNTYDHYKEHQATIEKFPRY